jgi:hypothetical protein
MLADYKKAFHGARLFIGLQTDWKIKFAPLAAL